MSFDLGAMLKDVSNLDTSREQIEYIRLDQIDGDPNNFYQISGIDALADNIATCGLQQPIRVRKKPDGRYITVSGHRRRAALELLSKDDPQRWEEIACIVELDAASPALQQLRLIYANANTRTMTSAELGEQAAQVEKLLYQLKEEGYEFPGRMRDHVAEAVNASKTKLARLKVIRENLADCWMPFYKNNTIVESTAYELAHMPKAYQEIYYAERTAMKSNFRFIHADDIKKCMERMAAIDKLTCKKFGKMLCQNRDAKLRQSAHTERYFDCPCTKCCDGCDKLDRCKNACPLLAYKIKQIKADKKEARQQEKLETQAKERPVIDYIRGVYERVGEARRACGASVKDLYKAEKAYYTASDDQKQISMESGTADISINTTLPFGYSFRYEDATRLCAVADLLGVSIDYLLGREVSNSDTAPSMETIPNPDAWRTGDPPERGDYVVYASWGGSQYTDCYHWDGNAWSCGGDPDTDEVLAWTYPPKADTLYPAQ